MGAPPCIYTYYNPNIPEPEVVIPPTYGAYHPQVGIIIPNMVEHDEQSCWKPPAKYVYIEYAYMYIDVSSVYIYNMYA